MVRGGTWAGTWERWDEVLMSGWTVCVSAMPVGCYVRRTFSGAFVCAFVWVKSVFWHFVTLFTGVASATKHQMIANL
jgi:hypothetical protein